MIPPNKEKAKAPVKWGETVVIWNILGLTVEVIMRTSRGSLARKNVKGVTSGGREHAFVFHARVSDRLKTEITFFRFRRQG
jgi:hypothetical protein